MNPLISVLIPAYNSERWIGATLDSVLSQTWANREVIVVDDGSEDATAEVARRYQGKDVKVVVRENGGSAAARNHAYSLAQGEYIQWLDADDLLSPGKLESQVNALLRESGGKLLASGPWGFFRHRPRKARFIANNLCRDLQPADWLVHKMGENLHMQTATWLTPRRIAEAAGPWDPEMHVDDDGEYFCRVLLASEGTRFVPEGRVYYRIMPRNRVSYIGNSDRKKTAMLESMERHIASLRSLEESERVREACLNYIHTWLIYFYPEREDIVSRLRELAKELGGELVPPRLNRKYSWMIPLFGWERAKEAEFTVPEFKSSVLQSIDHLLLRLEGRRGASGGGRYSAGSLEKCKHNASV